MPVSEGFRPQWRVLLADDHSLLRDALATLLDARLDVAVIGQAADGREAVELTGVLHPDIVIMDVAMPRLNGVEATRQIKARYPSTKVLILSAYGEEIAVGEAMAAGASGFIIKRSDIDELVLALDLVGTGNTYFSRELASKMDVAEISFAARSRTPSHSTLTVREREVLQLIAEGMTMKAIAELLVLSVKTVEGHNGRIMAKVGARNRAALVRYAIAAGLVQFDECPSAFDLDGAALPARAHSA